jgi:Cof subfamily protein (haloacid dehalogenase superfamily)
VVKCGLSEYTVDGQAPPGRPAERPVTMGCVTHLPGLVACDLDGTLLRTDLSVSARTLDTLDALSAAGIPFVIVTGRPSRWMAPVLEQTGNRGPIVCANGAVVLDPATGQTLAQWPIEVAALAEITERLRDAVPGIAFAAEYGDLLVREEHYPTRLDDGRDDVRVGEMAEILARPVPKLLGRLPDTDADELLARADAAIAGLGTPTHSSFTGLVEISAAGVTKATGLAYVAERYGVDPADVVAFGDMPNDIPMLEWAGRSVVVGNAHEAARAVATGTTGRNDEDGVAAHLEQLLGLSPSSR